MIVIKKKILISQPKHMLWVLKRTISFERPKHPGPHSAVDNVSDCRSRGREFDPDPVPYFRGD